MSARSEPFERRLTADAVPNEASATARQLLAFASGGVLLAFALVLIPVHKIDGTFLVLAGIAAVATVLVAALSPRFPRTANLAVALLYVLMVALLRSAEGGASSGFGGLFLVPVIWLGLTGGVFEISVALAAISLAQIVPLVAIGAPDYPSSGWRGVLVLTAAAAVAGFTIQVLLSETRASARENARWSKRLESLAELSNALASETQLDRLLDVTADRLRQLLSARLVVVLVPAPDGGLRCAAAAGERARELVGRLLPQAEPQATAALVSRQPHLDSTSQSELLDERPSLWVPLVANDRAIGVLAAFDQLGAPDGSFSEADLRLSQLYAARAALAVELSERVAADVVRHVVAAQEGERQRLARELHDETGQALTSMLMQLKSLEQAYPERSRGMVAGLRQTVVDTLRGVRRIVVELRPKALDDLGLVPALERLTASFAEQTNLEVSFSSGEFPERLSPELETALYRITQEGLTNVVRHAGATEATVLLAPTGESVLLVIADDGHGFDPDRTATGGFGINGIRERVQLLGGRLDIESSSGGSTSLTIEVPVS